MEDCQEETFHMKVAEPVDRAKKTNLGDKQDDEATNQESVEVRVHPHHVVEDGHEGDGRHDEQGELGQLLADVVHVRSVHAIKMFSQKHRQFQAENLNVKKFFLFISVLSRQRAF